MMNRIKEEDNPVLMIVDLKNARVSPKNDCAQDCIGIAQGYNNKKRIGNIPLKLE